MILSERGSQVNMKNYYEFESCRRVLAAKRKQLTKKGLGNKPDAARELEDEEIDLLFKKGFFGTQEPMALQRAVWWTMSLHFGFRAREETKKMEWGDVSVAVVKGRETLIWLTERGTKTRTGANPQGHKRKFESIAAATGTERCPVRIYKLFESHRPERMKKRNSPFYLGIQKNWNNREDSVGCLPVALGKNQIGKFLSSASTIITSEFPESNFSRISNHSVRKTSITRLLDNYVPPTFVQQLSGHRNIESLNSYHKASKSHQIRMSDNLSGGDESSKEKENHRSAKFYPAVVSSSVHSKSSYCQYKSSSSDSATATMPSSVPTVLSSLNVSEKLETVSTNASYPGQSVFTGSINNCVFQVYNCQQPPFMPANSAFSGQSLNPLAFPQIEPESPPEKRRRAYILESDEE